MDRERIAEILQYYGIGHFSEYRIIDSSRNNSYRLNIIIEDKYILRIHDGSEITEKRLEEIDKLAARYRQIDVLAPKLLKNDFGKYALTMDDQIAYMSEYLAYETCEVMDKELFIRDVHPDLLKMTGRFSKKFSGVDLSETFSMWSIFDLAPFDEEVDEKQENLNTLLKFLDDEGFSTLAAAFALANKENRTHLKKIYKDLPRTVIQGDLNSSNILIKDGKFVGLIDFNMAGTEVNVNHFCAETNGFPDFDDMESKKMDEALSDWLNEQECSLGFILSEYTLNDVEKIALPLYRNLGLISQYPNVMSYIRLMKRDKNLGERMLRSILKIVKGKYDSAKSETLIL